MLWVQMGPHLHVGAPGVLPQARLRTFPGNDLLATPGRREFLKASLADGSIVGKSFSHHLLQMWEHNREKRQTPFFLPKKERFFIPWLKAQGLSSSEFCKAKQRNGARISD